MTRGARQRKPGQRAEGGPTPVKRPRPSHHRDDPPRGKGRLDLSGSAGKIAIVLVLAGGIGIVAYNTIRTDSVGSGAMPASAVVEPARLSTLASAGKALFEANCAACHGPKANGTEQGPPFVNDIYNPGHHPDEAFLLAARNGVRAHHWQFGNMPPVEGVSEADIAAITRYVRELQEANGIRFRAHVM